MGPNAKQLQERIIENGLNLAESAQWRDYMVALREGYKARHGFSCPEHMVSTTAILLENTRDYINRMDETTRVVNMGNFVDYGFDVITAVVPNLIANEVCSVQPLNAKHGAIFYLNYLFGTQKGRIQAGTVMNSPFSGSTLETDYSGEGVPEEVVGTGDGTKTSFNTVLGYFPVRPGTISVVVGGVTGLDNGQGVLAGTGLSGTINYETGAITVTTTAAPSNGTKVLVTYSYDSIRSDVGVPQVDLDLKSTSIEAFPRKLRARWLLDASYELQKIKGIDAESELMVALSSEIKHEIDGEILNDIYRLAGLTGYSWDATRPAEISQQDHKVTLIDVFTRMSNDVFKATKRVGANFAICGINVCTILEAIGAPRFVPANLGSQQINGPHFVGTIDGKFRIYKNPFMNDNAFVLGFKGNSYIDAGFVYAPYMPLYATPTTVLDDFVFRKGIATSYGKLMLNSSLYAKGVITNFSTATYGGK